MSGDVQPKPYSVSSLTAKLKSALESGFTRIYVEAEISGWKLYPSGHAYFTLKDSGAQIQAVMFASAIARCRAKAGLRDGAKVVVYGNVSVYAPRGNYQLVVLAAKLAGEGDLMQRYLELKDRLAREGLFDAERKRPLPAMPRRIAVVTSEAGAVIHDMCTVLTRRFPTVEIRLFPCMVQGAEAPPTIVRGIEYFNSQLDGGDGGWKADVLIIARGGGSFEDLFCFNDETLVRAVAASRIPTVSAVGHETDFTLCDFAADVRAGTPSIAAETVVPVLSEIVSRLSALDMRLAVSLRSKGEWFAQRIDHLWDSLGGALALCRERLENRFARAETKLALLSPYSVLERGYSLTVTEDGAVVKDAASLSPGDRIVTRFSRGETVSEVVA
ncbi:MAG: exodeoxyribonuclease VII large subunit [Kiritimatiellae bacterium]|nr:exodeoxyribonuclease VII large subunit [Kiritimatiellia bacterium]